MAVSLYNSSRRPICMQSILKHKFGFEIHELKMFSQSPENGQTEISVWPL